MNRYLQKILEIKFLILANIVYQLKYSSFSQKTKAAKLLNNPLISIIVPVYKPKVLWLDECINSVINQTYTNWELILVDDNSQDMEITKLLEKYDTDSRIKIIVNSTNLNIVGATNKGIKQAGGDWVGFLDHDDIIWSNALFEVAQAINSHPDMKLIYTDQDKIDESTHHFDPFLKQDYNFSLLRQTNYFNHFTLIQKDLLQKLNYLRPGTDLAQDWDLVLRATNNLSPHEIFHLPRILYSWRVSSNSTASSAGMTQNQNKISQVQQHVLEYDLNFRKKSSTVSQSRYLGIWSTDNHSTILPYQFHLHTLLCLLKL